MSRKTYVAVCLVVILVESMDCSSTSDLGGVGGNVTTDKASASDSVVIEGGGSIPVKDKIQVISIKPEETPVPESPKKSKSHPRKGVDWHDFHVASSTPSSTSSTVKPNSTIAHPTNSTRKRKPTQTFVPSDGQSDSFIESSTTGKDFVFPIVLAILIFPLLLLVVRFIYKRGTEFSERQQYRRMYLIDGMYNSR